MTHTYLVAAQTLPDAELLERVTSLAARERGATAELIAHLAELETRNLHVAAGYGSMFAYCHEGLLLSEHEAYNRIEVARAARRFPVILDLLVQGAVNLTTVRLLAPHLTPDNHHEVLASARGLRIRDVEKIVARLAPRPDVPTSVRRLPGPNAVPVPASPPLPTIDSVVAVPEPAATSATPPTASAVEPPPARAAIRPLSPERYKMQLTISGDVLEKLELAKDLLRHAIPTGDDAAILERALDTLLTDLMKKKFAATDQPRRSQGTGGESRNVPAEVKRAVYLRDRGRCAYVATSGRRCHERAFIEFHHVHPYAHGGPATVENVALRCRRHNAYEWQQEAVEPRVRQAEWQSRQLAVEGRT